MDNSDTQFDVGDQGDETPQDGHFTARELANARRSPHQVLTTRPPLLGYTSVILIIVNRMIGTGIFRTPTILAQYTHSTAYSLLFWSAGAIVAGCGAYVFAEFGLTIPRLRAPCGIEQSVPRNGGEKNYLEYLLKSPRMFATCLYGIPFIVLGTAAGNAMICAECLLLASTSYPPDEPSKAAVRGLAISIMTFACLLHALSRKGGIWLFNLFGALKIAILLTMFASGLAFTGGAFNGSSAIAEGNLSIHNSTKDPAHNAYGYAEAFLAVLFAIGGYNQASYVLGEIDHNPRRNFKLTTIGTAVSVGILYVLVNLAYMMVVPEADQVGIGSDTVAALFFQRIFGPQNGRKIQYSFTAFSALGNVIVQAFTAARVKQELAKEGILPWTKFFASNKSLVPRLWSNRQSTSQLDDSSSATPVGALLLHWSFSAIVILATIPASIGESYTIFVSLYSYVVDAIFGFAVGLGLLVLRLRKESRWSMISKTNNKYCSITTALIFTLANFLPLVVIWIPPKKVPQVLSPVEWWTTGTIGMGLMGVALLYWMILTYVVPAIRGRNLEVEREVALIQDHDQWIVVQEITSVNWRVRPTKDEDTR